MTTAHEWVKSSYSNGDINCVEVRVSLRGVAMRDSKQRSGPVIVTTRRGWSAFVAGLRD
ncbi:DUF397 domain-containing protein [Streptomyces sp. SID4919]|uniref:DUF397 domain-containing protein n=1 Tax=unclassified Streptomyces TaxID=2593676 RepID=UPI000823CC89|nr:MULTISPECIES: DUF397 domain-containing protein [unclassified Streptomyces]MYY08837.1 DUF397 domain-containing protein [Streptomyces sp. SID4919]SCK25700.1 protein of unknown function [Streptomyces sp. AmelKG-E11A]